MIISHKHKYIFIGLPYSASSAISKELIEQYHGEALFHKHSNIPLLLKKRPVLELEQYQIFAVVRDPLEMCLSVYNKHVNNPHNTFTHPRYFIENGGFVSKKARLFYQKFHKKEMNFQDFLNAKYRLVPYDNNLSLNGKFLNSFIRFEYLSSDFEITLNRLGIIQKRELPHYNKTRKQKINQTIPKVLYDKIFSPFLNYNKLFFDETTIPEVTFASEMKFKIYSGLRYHHILRYDFKQMNNAFSILDLKNER